jgi:hypothetical protein
MIDNPRFRAGDWVEVRRKEEILQTLNERAELDRLPFMPEMFQYCGKRFEVYKRAHKTCDPPNGTDGRRMRRTVHLLNLRCDGEGHGGCQAGCRIFWKEAWLKKVAGPKEREITSDAHGTAEIVPPKMAGTNCTEAVVLARTRANGNIDNGGEPLYTCQNTCIAAATEPQHWWDIRQYIEDVTSRNEPPSQLAFAFLFFVYTNLAEAGVGFGAPLRWAYDQFQSLRGGTPYPLRAGRVPKGKQTPVGKLDLQPGETVKVKGYEEILNTLDKQWKNRGMYFDREMVPFCNKTFRVQERVRQIIDEKTGKMIRFKGDAIILQDVFCQSRFSECRKFCPRGIHSYWREIWLERATENGIESK